jgi:flagellar hook-associated protein 2
MATITFGGLATGLNTQAIIEGLVAVERRPITLLKNQQAKLQEKTKLYQDLSGKLAALKTAVTKLSTTANFFIKTAKSSKEDVLVASASSSAPFN